MGQVVGRVSVSWDGWYSCCTQTLQNLHLGLGIGTHGPQRVLIGSCKGWDEGQNSEGVGGAQGGLQLILGAGRCDLARRSPE